MSKDGCREIELWEPDVHWEHRSDGTTLVWQAEPLGDFPDKLSDCILHWAKERPDHTWMAERGEDDEWRRVSYSQLLILIRGIGQFLLDLKLSVDKPLVILSENSTEHALAALAAQYAGIPSAAIATAYSLVSEDYAKLKSIAEQLTPGAIFAKDARPFTNALGTAFAPEIPLISVIGEADGRTTHSWSEVIATEPRPDVDQANAATGPDTIAKFLFTSGTTGTPKAVIQTQRVMCSNMAMVTDCYAFMKTEPPVILDWAPWNHVASGTKVFNMAIYNGGTYYIDAGKPSPAGIKETIRNLNEISPTWYFNVPAGYQMLADAMEADAALARNFFKDLKMLMYAGAGMAAHTWDQLRAIAYRTVGERILLCSGLGATETGPFATFCTEEQDLPGNIGIPVKGVTLKLVPVGDKLEARFKGPNVTPGYWRAPELTETAFDEEGFYRIGDALRYADPKDPGKGFFFDGRTAENFKLQTGTWVAVGAVRTALVDAMGGLIHDAVITGENQEMLGAIMVPYRPAIEKLVPNGQAMREAELLSQPEVREKIETLLAVHAKAATGSASRVLRAAFIDGPLNPDRGEVTDKGSLNQRAVRENRVHLVDAIYEGGSQVFYANKRGA